MKKMLSLLLLALILTSGSCLAEYSPVTDLAPFAGLWSSIGANDKTPYLVIHADGTLETYDYAEDEQREHGALMTLTYSGAYTFDENGFRFPGDERVYTVQTEVAERDYQSSDMTFTISEGVLTLCFNAELVEMPEYSYDPSCFYMPAGESRNLLPTAQALLGGWFVYDEEEDITPYITFRENGTAALRDCGEAVYELDNGRLTITKDGVKRVFYLQHTLRYSEDLSEFEQALYEDELELNPDWGYVREKNRLEVFEIKEDGTITSLLLSMPNG